MFSTCSSASSLVFLGLIVPFATISAEPITRAPVPDVALTSFFSRIPDSKDCSPTRSLEVDLLYFFGPAQDHEKLLHFYRTIEHKTVRQSPVSLPNVKAVSLEMRRDIIFRIVVEYTLDHAREVPVLSFVAPFIVSYGEPTITVNKVGLTYGWKDNVTSLTIDAETDVAQQPPVRSYTATYSDVKMVDALDGEKRDLHLSR